MTENKCLRKVDQGLLARLQDQIVTRHTLAMMMCQELGLCPTCALYTMVHQLVSTFQQYSGGVADERVMTIIAQATASALDDRLVIEVLDHKNQGKHN